MSGVLSRPIVRMPEFGSGEWLNSPALTKSALRDRVVLIDFWEFSCVNCIRTVPYLVNWHRRYHDTGLTIIGVHAPEFQFGRQRKFVQSALAEFEITYPVLLDNELATWDRYANKAWPTKYLIDSNGYIRYQRRGEGGYIDTELGIQQLLSQLNPNIVLPPIPDPIRPEDMPGAACYKSTPELHAGYSGGLFGGMIGNESGFWTNQVFAYEPPPKPSRSAGQFYIEGFWLSRAESLDFAGRAEGRLILPYAAAGVNAVLSPTGDQVELMLDMLAEKEIPLVELLLDDQPIPTHWAGQDVYYDEAGRSLIKVDRPRMYFLLKHQSFEERELTMVVRTYGMAVFAFTFTSCVVTPP